MRRSFLPVAGGRARFAAPSAWPPRGRNSWAGQSTRRPTPSASLRFTPAACSPADRKARRRVISLSVPRRANGLLALLATEQGLTGPKRALEDPRGFCFTLCAEPRFEFLQDFKSFICSTLRSNPIPARANCMPGLKRCCRLISRHSQGAGGDSRDRTGGADAKRRHDRSSGDADAARGDVGEWAIRDGGDGAQRKNRSGVIRRRVFAERGGASIDGESDGQRQHGARSAFPEILGRTGDGEICRRSGAYARKSLHPRARPRIR